MLGSMYEKEKKQESMFVIAHIILTLWDTQEIIDIYSEGSEGEVGIRQ